MLDAGEIHPVHGRVVARTVHKNPLTGRYDVAYAFADRPAETDLSRLRWLVETPIDDEGAPDVPNDPIPEPNDGDGEAAPGTEPTEEGKP